MRAWTPSSWPFARRSTPCRSSRPVASTSAAGCGSRCRGCGRPVTGAVRRPAWAPAVLATTAGSRLRPIAVDFASELLMSVSWLQRLLDQLALRRQIVLYGAPGTGRTWLARRIAGHAFESDDVCVIQVHPSYTHEDFVEGYRPRTENGVLTHPLERGPLRELSARAAARPDRRPPPATCSSRPPGRRPSARGRFAPSYIAPPPAAGATSPPSPSRARGRLASPGTCWRPRRGRRLCLLAPRAPQAASAHGAHRAAHWASCTIALSDRCTMAIRVWGWPRSLRGKGSE